MTYSFLRHPLHGGAYEPEGIYLALPLAGECLAVQTWGDHPEHYSQFRYNGVALKGHNGIDFLTLPEAKALAVAPGRVIEIGEERGGWERYLKIEHPWGESLYAHIDTILVDAGQLVTRQLPLATIASLIVDGIRHNENPGQSYLHFGLRIKPYNRFDGWGGFVDPLPYLNPQGLVLPSADNFKDIPPFLPHNMIQEFPQSRRP